MKKVLLMMAFVFSVNVNAATVEFFYEYQTITPIYPILDALLV